MKMRRMDRTAVYAVAATKLALDDAGVSIPPDGDDRRGVMLGTWTAGGGSTQIFLDALFRQGPTGAPALLFDSTVANSAASIVGLEHQPARAQHDASATRRRRGSPPSSRAVDHPARRRRGGA